VHFVFLLCVVWTRREIDVSLQKKRSQEYKSHKNPKRTTHIRAGGQASRIKEIIIVIIDERRGK
jgi:hypothetical protein